MTGTPLRRLVVATVTAVALTAGFVSIRGADAAATATVRDCGRVVIGGRPNRVVASGISCSGAITRLRSDDSDGFDCAASVRVCWQGPSPERAAIYYWAMSIVMTSTRTTVLAAAREIASRHVARFGINITGTAWRVGCGRGSRPIRAWTCRLNAYGGYCQGTLGLYQNRSGRFEALNRIEIGCKE